MSKHLYIYSPSSSIRDRQAFRRGVARLKRLGYEVELDPAALTHHQRFAGTDDERLQAIARAATSGADAVLISRGGYGLTRLLPQLPYAAIRKSIETGTQWVGLSDFTALQLALMAQQPGSFTWAGPAVGEDFGADSARSTEQQPLPDDIMEACFQDLMDGVAEGAGWRLNASDRQMLPDSQDPQVLPLEISGATLWGGNLSVLVNLLGTPYFPQVDGGILFLEDVAEHPYRIERMLTQLLYSGVLARQKVLLLGQFTEFRPVNGYDRGFGLKAVLQRLRGQLPQLPIFSGLPFGHVPTKVLLPVGKPVYLLCDGRDVILQWELAD